MHTIGRLVTRSRKARQLSIYVMDTESDELAFSLAEIERIGKANDGVMPSKAMYNRLRKQGALPQYSVLYRTGGVWADLAERLGLSLDGRQKKRVQRAQGERTDADAVLAEIKRIGETLGGIMPSQSVFNQERSEDMPTALGAAYIVGCPWSELAERVGLSLNEKQAAKVAPPPLEVRQSDSAAIEQLWESMRQEIFTYILRRVKHLPEWGLAEELTMETYAVALAAARRGTLPTIGNPNGWLVNIAYHCVCEYFNRRKLRVQQVSLEPDEDADWLDWHFPADEPEPGDLLIEKEMRARALAVVRDNTELVLTENEQRVFELRLEGYDNNEIGDILGIVPNTVREYVYRGRKKLRMKWPPDLLGLPEGALADGDALQERRRFVW